MVQMRLKKEVGGIMDLYNVIAEQLGFDHTKCNYDCTKIKVSVDIEETIRSKYEDTAEFAMSWIIFGPKVDDQLTLNTVAIGEGFISEEV